MRLQQLLYFFSSWSVKNAFTHVIVAYDYPPWPLDASIGEMFICKDFFKHANQQDIMTMTPFIVYIYFLYLSQFSKLPDTPALIIQLHDIDTCAIDPAGSKASIHKLDWYMEYLSGRTLTLAFAFKRVRNVTKD
jgi:hypothetical protein